VAGRFRGASFERAVEHARETRAADGLCPPLALARGAVDDSKVRAWAVWGVFNPFGSSRVRLLSVETGAPEGEALLVHEVSHPRHPRCVAHGWIGEQALPTLRELLVQRASGGSEPVLPAPPTHVDLASSLLGEPELRELIYGSLGDRPELDLAAACDLIERHGVEVKQRTVDELRGALATMSAQHAGRHRPPGPPTPELLERWWRLVTDVEFGAGERAAIDELGGAHLRVRPPLEPLN